MITRTVSFVGTVQNIGNVDAAFSVLIFATRVAPGGGPIPSSQTFPVGTLRPGATSPPLIFTISVPNVSGGDVINSDAELNITAPTTIFNVARVNAPQYTEPQTAPPPPPPPTPVPSGTLSGTVTISAFDNGIVMRGAMSAGVNLKANGTYGLAKAQGGLMKLLMLGGVATIAAVIVSKVSKRRK